MEQQNLPGLPFWAAGGANGVFHVKADGKL